MLVLSGVLIVILGFAMRLNPLVVVAVAGVVTGIAGGSGRAQILDNPAHLLHFQFVRIVPPLLLKRARIPLAHRLKTQQARRVCRSSGVELEAVALHAKRNRSKEGIDGRETLAREERATNARPVITARFNANQQAFLDFRPFALREPGRTGT